MNKMFLIDLEQKALAKRREGAYGEAVDLWLELVRFDPNWEHGMAQHEISGCFEELGNYQKAREHLNIALGIEPENEMYLGAKASLEYLHGDPTEALELYLALAYTYKGQEERVDRIRPAIFELGARLGLNQTTVAILLAAALQKKVLRCEPEVFELTLTQS